MFVCGGSFSVLGGVLVAIGLGFGWYLITGFFSFGVLCFVVSVLLSSVVSLYILDCCFVVVLVVALAVY